MKVHFVYSVPAISISSRIQRELSHRLGYGSGWIGARKDVCTNSWPSYSPISITRHVYEELRSRFDTLLYDYQERGVIRGGRNDILIGHPDPTDPRSIWNQSCERGEFAARIALFPIHHGLPDMNAPVDTYVRKVDAILGITGPYWYDTWQNSAFAHWKPKITPVDMAIDVGQFPRIKKRFNRPGRRKFLFIGNSKPYKGVHLLSILFGLAKNHTCVWLGGPGGLSNLDSRRGFVAFTPKYMAQVADECDFFITMGVSDANPTTILESMAWGFPVCCTPQSGYYNMPEIEGLSTTDMQHNLSVLERLQQAPECELLQKADAARKLVERDYTWRRFTRTVLTQLTHVAGQKGLRVGVTTAEGLINAYS